MDLSYLCDARQAYVALSRTKTLQHVTLETFDQTKLECSSTIHHFYKEVFRASTLHENSNVAAPSHNSSSMSSSHRLAAHSSDQTIVGEDTSHELLSIGECLHVKSSYHGAAQTDVPRAPDLDQQHTDSQQDACIARGLRMSESLLYQQFKRLSNGTRDANTHHASSSHSSSSTCTNDGLLSNLEHLQLALQQLHADIAFYEHLAHQSLHLRASFSSSSQESLLLPSWLTMAIQSCLGILHNPGPSKGGHAMCLAECMAIINNKTLLEHSKQPGHDAIEQLRAETRAQNDVLQSMTNPIHQSQPTLHLLHQCLSNYGLTIGVLCYNVDGKYGLHGCRFGSIKDAQASMFEFILLYDAIHTHLLLMHFPDMQHAKDFLNLIGLNDEIAQWHEVTATDCATLSILDMVAMGHGMCDNQSI